MRTLTKRLSLILSIFSLLIVGACGASIDNQLSKEAASEALAVETENSAQLIASDLEQVEKGKVEQANKEMIQLESFSNIETDDFAKVFEEIDDLSGGQKQTVTKQENGLNNQSNQDTQNEAKQESSRSDHKAQTSGRDNKTSNNSSDQSSEQKELSQEKVDELKPDQTDNLVEATITYSIIISDDETPLPPTEMTVKEDDTVLEALIRITKDKAIQMDYRGGRGATAYVEGIGNVYEFDRGPGSGWMYRVNGIFPDRGAGAVQLLPGDRVEWLYTTDLGKDLGADLKPFRR